MREDILPLSIRQKFPVMLTDSGFDNFENRIVLSLGLKGLNF